MFLRVNGQRTIKTKMQEKISPALFYLTIKTKILMVGKADRLKQD
jgi:hypothetical protein